MKQQTLAFILFLLMLLESSPPSVAQIGHRLPSEKKIVPDPVTGVPLSFLTSTPAGDRKLYQTHPQWTADGKWLIFESQRMNWQALAVHEETGDIVQVTEKGYAKMLCVAQKSMRLFHLRLASNAQPVQSEVEAPSAADTTPAPTPEAFAVVAIDLARVFADSEAGTIKPAAAYEHILGTIPAGMASGYELVLDANEEAVYFRLTAAFAAKCLPPDTKQESAFGPRGMGAGPSGIGSMNLKTGEVKVVAAVPFAVGHIQNNPWVPGELVFCWETGGKAPQRTWTVRADGTGLRPIYPEAPYDWVTHETVITRDEVAMSLMGHRPPGTNDEWGPSGTREHATGLGIVNLRTRVFYLAGQTKSGSGLWHVNGSPDGRWLVGDDFDRNIYLIDRHTGEMLLLSTGHKPTSADHPHPSFSPDSTRIQIQSAMLSEDGRSMNICVIPVPDAWLKRTYSDKVMPDQGSPSLRSVLQHPIKP